MEIAAGVLGLALMYLVVSGRATAVVAALKTGNANQAKETSKTK